MDRNIEAADLELVELGSVSAETKGPPGAVGELEGRHFIEGLADD